MRYLTLPTVSSAPASLNVADRTAADALPLSRYLVFAGVSVLGCLVDLLTKQWVFAWRGLPQKANEWWLWEPFVGIETTINTGALFGMGSGWGKVFAFLSILAAIGIPIWMFWFGAARSRWLTFALSC